MLGLQPVRGGVGAFGPDTQVRGSQGQGILGHEGEHI